VGWTTRELGFDSLWGQELFLFLKASRPPPGGPSCPLFSGYKGVKFVGHQVDHSPPSHYKVKRVMSYTSSSQYVFVIYLIKHRNNFVFTFLQMYRLTGIEAESCTLKGNRIQGILY
jgi:hypothetical protein